MENQNTEKYLFHLTEKEFTILLKAVIKDELPKIIKAEFLDLLRDELDEIKHIKRIPERDSISAAEASTLTGLRIKTIYTKVSRMEMPVLTRGRPLMFSHKGLTQWMRDGKPTVLDMGLAEYKANRKL